VPIRHFEELEKRGQVETYEEGERLALERHLRELDRATLDDIERKFGQYVPRGRMERLRQEPARFLGHEDYERHLRERGIEPSENGRVLGDANGRVYVDREHILVPRTLVHERLHQVSDKLYRGMLGREIDEGTTEYFASKLRGDLHLVDMGRSYPDQKRLVEMLSARVDDDTIARAYFQGDWIGLQREIDGQLGSGALAEISALAKQGKVREAEEIIKKGL
jgi:hypothetical protein